MQIQTQRLAIAVETMPFVDEEEPVLHASLPMESCAGPNLKGGNATGENEKHRLVSILWDHLTAMGNHLWIRDSCHDGTGFSIRLVRGWLGRPRLLLGDDPGPAISFSWSGHKVWAALCGSQSDIGIDVAQSIEFKGEYPFARVLHPQELDHALKLAGNDLEKASALLWSIKEAVVKALGCGFHLVDPKQIMVYPADRPSMENGAYAFPVGLSEKAARRLPVSADRFLQVRSLSREKMWLSIALFNGRHRCNHGRRRLNTRGPWREMGNLWPVKSKTPLKSTN